MKLKALFKFCIKQGIARDPRGVAAVEKVLEKKKQQYDKLAADEKEDFDTELLDNPYADSRLLVGAGDENISSVLVGIDMESAEVLAAHMLRQSGRKVDLILSHHPEGKAYAGFYKVIDMQADIMHSLGVPIGAAESMIDSRLKEVGRKVMPQNHNRAVDIARLFNIPMMSTHTVADNQVASFLQDLFDAKKPETLGDALDLLKKIPEYREAAKGAAGPFILCGSKDNRAGKIFVDMTGGTEGPKESLAKLAAAGVGTIVGMHMSEDHYKEAEKNHLRVIIAGHISSDTLGMNLLLDAAEKALGPLEIIECSGFRRFRRNGK